MQGTTTLHSAIMDSLKMENLNERINDLLGIDIMSFVFTTSVVIFSLKSDLITVPNMITLLISV